jgi:tRNA(fMet)-specific endonuclease VapC
MIILDTDILTLHLHGHPAVTERAQRAGDEMVTTAVSRIEVLRGRFDSVLKAATGEQLSIAQERLADTERRLAILPIVPFDGRSAAEFDRLRADRKLRNIGRADLLIACIAPGPPGDASDAQPPPLPPGRRLGPRRLGGVTPVVARIDTPGGTGILAPCEPP